MDLISDMEKRPVATQLRYSILNYIMSADFNPSKIIKMTDLEKLNLDKF